MQWESWVTVRAVVTRECWWCSDVTRGLCSPQSYHKDSITGLVPQTLNQMLTNNDILLWIQFYCPGNQWAEQPNPGLRVKLLAGHGWVCLVTAGSWLTDIDQSFGIHKSRSFEITRDNSIHQQLLQSHPLSIIISACLNANTKTIFTLFKNNFLILLWCD